MRTLAFPDAAGDFLYELPPPGVVEDALAEVNAFYTLNRAADRLLALGAPPVVDLEVITNLRSAEECTVSMPTLAAYDNAYFDSDARRPRLAFGQGSHADLAYDGDIVIHELVHAVQHFMHVLDDGVVRLESWGRSDDVTAITEATADYFAAALGGSARIGGYAFPDHARDLAAPRRCPADLVGEPHDDGMFLSSALWRAREAAPAAGRELLDRAVMRVLSMLGADTTLDGFAAAIVAEVELGGDAAMAQALRDAFADTGILPGCARVVDRALDETLPPILLIADAVDRVAPMSYQVRLTLAAPVEALRVRTASVFLGHTRYFTSVVFKQGEPIRWDPATGSHDGREASLGLGSAEDHIILGPFPAGPLYLQLGVRHADEGALVLENVRFVAATITPPPDAGGSAAMGDGGGCATGGSATASPSALAVLLLLSVAGSRASRRSRR
jgi:hypothetical protein